MRLAQLARKIAVKPADIVSFLASQNIQIEEGSNAKVADEYEKLVLRHFAPELLAPQPEIEEIAQPAPVVDEPVETLSDQIEIAAVEKTPEVEEIKEEDKPELIKPPKVELPGLKVVGKIDLPEPKKKTPEPEVEVSAEATPLDGEQPAAPADGEQPAKSVGDTRGQQRDRKSPHRHDRRQRDEQRPRMNPIALQREREEREALRKKLEDQEKQKELRTQRYLKKVEGKATQSRPSKKSKKKREEEYEVYTEKPQPKSLLGKIMNWFVSE